MLYEMYSWLLLLKLQHVEKTYRKSFNFKPVIVRVCLYVPAMQVYLCCLRWSIRITHSANRLEKSEILERARLTTIALRAQKFTFPSEYALPVSVSPLSRQVLVTTFFLKYIFFFIIFFSLPFGWWHHLAATDNLVYVICVKMWHIKSNLITGGVKNAEYKNKFLWILWIILEFNNCSWIVWPFGV